MVSRPSRSRGLAGSATYTNRSRQITAASRISGRGAVGATSRSQPSSSLSSSVIDAATWRSEILTSGARSRTRRSRDPAITVTE